MNRITAEDGFSLIEILVASAIFLVGSLGTASMLLATGRMTQQGAEIGEATLVAEWKLEQLQTLPSSDPDLRGCPPPAGCYATIDEARKTDGPGTIAPADSVGGTARTQFQLRWINEAAVGGLMHYEVIVSWPRDRRIQGLAAADTGFVDCTDTATNATVDGLSADCKHVYFHTYRKVI